VLRALGASLGLGGFELTELAELRAQLTPSLAQAPSVRAGDRAAGAATAGTGLERIATVAPYKVDGVVRRAAALQATPVAAPARIVLNPADVLAQGLAQGATVKVSDGTHEATLPLEVSARVPQGAAWVEAGHAETAMLAGTGARLTVAGA
jgi:NADH-quinone oxidoreductase subunit G